MKSDDDYQYELWQIDGRLESIENFLKEVKGKVKFDYELWDGADIILNWKVSPRTLADWRAKGMIGYIQVGNKIWYPREARELFLNQHFIKAKN